MSWTTRTDIYGHGLPAWRLLDYDNLQQKQILDTAALYVMIDDSGFLCDVYNTMEQGEKDCTRIYIMEKNHFGKRFLEREKQLKAYRIIEFFCPVFPDIWKYGGTPVKRAFTGAF